MSPIDCPIFIFLLCLPYLASPGLVEDALLTGDYDCDDDYACAKCDGDDTCNLCLISDPKILVHDIEASECKAEKLGLDKGDHCCVEDCPLGYEDAGTHKCLKLVGTSQGVYFTNIISILAALVLVITLSY